MLENIPHIQELNLSREEGLPATVLGRSTCTERSRSATHTSTTQ